jgi:ribonuclease BN (tRNA processing enzyme)
VRLTVVGAGPAYSSEPGAVGACYLVRSGDRAIALDLGHGAFAGLAARLPPERLETVAISHLHPDHFVDLVPLRHYLRFHLAPPGRLRVDAHPELLARLDGLHAQPGFAAAALDLVPLEPGVREVGPFTIEVASVIHTADSYAFRVSDRADGPGLVYSGDVGVAADLRPLIRADDVLLVEVTFGAEPVPAGSLHLAGPAIGALAAEAGVARVLLTHLLMGHDPAAAIRSGEALFDAPDPLVHPGFEPDI